MHMKIKLLLCLICSTLIACNKNSNPTTHFEDYEGYITRSQLISNNPLKKEIKFWEERLRINPNDESSLLKLAGLYGELFKSSGLIQHVVLSDSIYNEVLKHYPEGNVEIYHSLCANAISQHQFQQAKDYAEKALVLKDKKATTLLLLVDVSLETGDYARANRILRQFTNKNSFAYLIRKVKMKDHEGMLDSAIVCMEKAYDRIKGNKSLAQWTLSNLGDMYGHAGRIEESYNAYLKVLKANPNDDYVLKGIAWIALSHDNNLKDAKRIILALSERRFMPEANLMLAEIAEIEGNELEKLAYLKKFRSIVSQPGYQTMYNKYLALLEAEEFKNAKCAIAIANNEILNRPTPQSFDLLAWAYYQDGKPQKALEIAKVQLENQTFEPESLYHLGIIYQANGNNAMAKRYLQEALGSRFELGPTISNKIQRNLEKL